MRYIIASIVLMLFLIAACSSSEIICPDGKIVKSQSECTKTRETTTSPPAPQELPEEPADMQALDPRIRALVELPLTRVQSYSFVHAPTVQGPAGTLTNPTDTYKVRDNLVKVEVKILPTKSVDETSFVDTAFLNLATEEIRAYCMSDDKHRCSIKGDSRPAEYNSYVIKLPTEWLKEIPDTAVITKGSLSFEERTVTVIRYSQDGQYYEMFLDQYSGMPLRVAIYSDVGYNTLIGGVEYQEFHINTIKEADVTPPK